MNSFPLACMICKTPLTLSENGDYRCPQDELRYSQKDGVWRFLMPDQEQRFLPFLDRAIEPNTIQNERVIQLIENRLSDHSVILDLGAGSGLLASHLAAKGHIAAAVDINAAHLEAKGTTLIHAEFDDLPVPDNSVDTVIYHNSFHYSIGYINTLSEALRVLKDDGLILIVASPFFNSKEQGVAGKANFDSVPDSLPSEEFLTPAWLGSLGELLSIEWEIVEIPRNWVDTIRALWERLIGKHATVRYPLIIGRRGNLPADHRPLDYL